MAWTCSRCGRENDAKKRFCAECQAPRVSDALVTEEGRRRSRRMLTIYITASVAFALITIASGVAYKYWWNSRPEFSVRQLPVSIVNRDLVEFERQMDIDSVARGIVDDAFAIGLDRIWRERGARGVAMAGKVADQVRESASGRVKSEIQEFVKAGGAVPEASADPERHRAWSALRIFFEACSKSPKGMTVEGNVCNVTISGTDERGKAVEFVVEVKRGDERWRVTRILNARDIMQERLAAESQN